MIISRQLKELLDVLDVHLQGRQECVGRQVVQGQDVVVVCLRLVNLAGLVRGAFCQLPARKLPEVAKA